MRHKNRTCLVRFGWFVIGLVVIIIGVRLVAGAWQDGLRPIPNGPNFSNLSQEEKFIRHRDTDSLTAIAHVPIPQHPFMAPSRGNNMHNDAYMSDTYAASGPQGLDSKIVSRTQGFGGYGTVAFDRAGRLVALYSNARRFQLELMHPYTLEEIASYDLPSRPWYFPLSGVMPWEYIGAGMYFYLDEQDRAVAPTTENSIVVIKTPAPGSGGGFELVRAYDLSDYVIPLPWPRQDSVAWALPDWEGEYYWFGTTEGVVGVVNIASGAVQSFRLEGEILENSFAVGEEGVFIISDRAMYRFSLAQGAIRRDWRTSYDRGPAKKPGHITRGSGSSVTLAGAPDDGIVMVTDNAEPKVRLLFLRRADGELVCSLPLFTDGQSGTDITAIGFEQAGPDGLGTGVYSAIVENNWGHNRFPFAHPAGGVTRVDLTRLPDGSYRCEEIWRSAEKNIGVFKLSLNNGLLYLYYKEEGASVFSEKWYFTALDFATGETVYKQLSGTGPGFNNWAGALFLHPDGGVAYSTTIFGLVMMVDAPP